MADRTNEEREARAAAALEAYAAHEGEVSSPSEDFGDLLADLMHLADTYGWDFDASVETARMNFQAERVA